MSPAAPLPHVESVLQDAFGQRPARASVSFVGVEPIEVLRFRAEPNAVVYVSLGMSRHPMTPAAAPSAAADGPRGELLLRVRDAGGFGDVWRRLALLAAAPAVEGVVYCEGMTVDLNEPWTTGSACTGAVVTAAALPVVPSPVGTVQLWELLPATADELAWSRVSGVAALRSRWRAHQTALDDLSRRPVRLD